MIMYRILFGLSLMLIAIRFLWVSICSIKSLYLISSYLSYKIDKAETEKYLKSINVDYFFDSVSSLFPFWWDLTRWTPLQLIKYKDVRMELENWRKYK